MKDVHLAVACALAPFFFASSAGAEPKSKAQGIQIQVTGLQENRGTIYCALFSAAKGFPDEPERARSRTKARPKNKKASCRFSDVEAGRYAIAVWHDVDDDGELDSNWIGIPSEPVGASNNAKGSFGPPKFADAAFDYTPPELTQTIEVE